MDHIFKKSENSCNEAALSPQFTSILKGEICSLGFTTRMTTASEPGSDDSRSDILPKLKESYKTRESKTSTHQ